MLNIIHHIENHSFEIVSDPDSARLDYELLNDSCINFTHTYVPFKLRGKGIAEALVQEGLKWAADQKLHITTSCWYVEKYIAEHPA